MKKDGLPRVGQRLIQGIACRKAAWQIRHHDAVRVFGIARHQWTGPRAGDSPDRTATPITYADLGYIGDATWHIPLCSVTQSLVSSPQVRRERMIVRHT